MRRFLEGRRGACKYPHVIYEDLLSEQTSFQLSCCKAEGDRVTT
jgi:hypothetical protein